MLTSVSFILGLLVAPANADEKPVLELKLVAKEDAYSLDTGVSNVKDYKALLENIQLALKKNAPKVPPLPKPPAVSLVLQIKNVSAESVTIHVNGDTNRFDLDLKGPAAFAIDRRAAFTADFRLPRAVVLGAGKTYEIPVSSLSDGFRGASRWLYWAEPGEYTLAATYQLASAEGGKGPLLKAAPIKLNVTEKK